VAGTPEDVAAHARKREKRQVARKKSCVPFFRSYTGEVLDPVLAAGPFVARRVHDFTTEEEKRDGDVEIAEVGRGARMPWEIDGRRWHTKDRVGRNGNPCRWDGKILADVIDRIEDSDLFSETDWSTRNVVEIRAAKKSHGWFFHAITGEEWLLKMKFRTAKNTFRREELVGRLDLKPLNEVPDLPLYGTEPRVKCKNLRSPWQEIELRVHGREEIDRPEFWKFVDQAMEGFRAFTERAGKKPEDLMPWKVLGRKWHLLRKGFPPGKRVRWDPAVLEQLVELLERTGPECKFVWSNKVVVPVHVTKRKVTWAVLATKKLDAVHLNLLGPKGRFALGQITGLGHAPELEAEHADYDLIRLKFRSTDDLARGDLAGFLKEHVNTLTRRK
jgi:excinuclease ABC subunit A